MKHLLVYLLIFCAVLTCSCEQEQKSSIATTTIIVNLAAPGQESLTIFNIEKGIHHELSGTTDSIILDIEEETILGFLQGRGHRAIHVKPGDRIVVDAISIKPVKYGIKEGASKENEHITAFTDLASSASTDPTYRMRKIADNPPDSFLLEIENKYQAYQNLQKNIENDEGLSTAFKSVMATRLLAAKGNDLLAYKEWYHYLNEENPVLPDDFYSSIEPIKSAGNKVLLFQEGRNFSKSWVSKDIVYEDFDSDGDYFNGLMQAAEKRYPNSLVGDYCYLSTLQDQVNFGTGIDGVGDAVKEFKATVTNTYLNTELDKTLGPWLHLKSGMRAPGFVATTRDGVSVKLSDLKGKKVYVDVWATWCGPCVAEIPFLKALEEELHDENIEFVSVSIDKESDKQKWLDFIEKEEMKGIQLMADGMSGLGLTNSYNIQGIPRFLLIDPEGKILSANAPRPSDPATKDLLMK